MARKVALSQIFVFMSLMAACLGLAVSEEPNHSWAIFTSFAPGAYLATGLLRASNTRFARRATTSAKCGAIGGALSSLAFLLPLSLEDYLTTSHHWIPLHEHIVITVVAALVIGGVEGGSFGWLAAKIFADWDRRRRWRLRRIRYGDVSP